MPPAIAALILLVFALAGCGGDGRAAAVETAETWLRAVADRDADRACGLMDPTAVDAIRQKFAGGADEVACPTVVRAYGDRFPDGEIERILDGGLEAEGPVKEGEVGVFPVSGPRELEVVLMRRVQDEWRVASTTVGPQPSKTPAATPSPSS